MAPGVNLAIPDVAFFSGGGSPAGNMPNVQQFFNRLAALPPAADQANFAALISAISADGTFGALDVLCLCAVQDIAVSLTEITSGKYQPQFTEASGVPAFTAYRGWSGFGAIAQKDIDSGFNPSSAASPHYSLDAATIAAWNLNATQFNSPLWSDATDALVECWPKYSDTKVYTQMNDATEIGVANVADGSGWFCVNRTAAGAYTVKRNNVLLNTGSTTATALPSSDIFFGHGLSATSQQLAAFAIGQLSASQETTLYNAVSAFLIAVGAI